MWNQMIRPAWEETANGNGSQCLCWIIPWIIAAVYLRLMCAMEYIRLEYTYVNPQDITMSCMDPKKSSYKVFAFWNQSSLKHLLTTFQPNTGLQETQVISVRENMVANKNSRDLRFQCGSNSLLYSFYAAGQLALIRYVNRTIKCNRFMSYVILVSVQNLKYTVLLHSFSYHWK